MLLAPGVISRLAPHATSVYLKGFAPELAEPAFVRGGITSRLLLAHFLAQILHETGGLAVSEENLSYSATRLCEVWPSRFPTEGAAEEFVRAPEKLGEKVYGGRMGNNEAGDGFKYRGRGLLQITGKEAYARIGKELGADLVGAPEKVLAPENVVAVAALEYAGLGANEPAARDDIVGVTRRVNGGLIGLPSRRQWLIKTKAALGLLH